MIGRAIDGSDYVVVHFRPTTTGPLVANGALLRMAAEEFRGSANRIVEEAFEAFRGATPKLAEYRSTRSIHRSHRFVSVSLRDGSVEFAPFHLVGSGRLRGCDPAERIRIPLDASIDMYNAALDQAFERCRGYPPITVQQATTPTKRR